MANKLEIVVDLETGQAVSNMRRMNDEMERGGRNAGALDSAAGKVADSLKAVAASYFGLQGVLRLINEFNESLNKIVAAKQRLGAEAQGAGSTISVLQGQLGLSRDNAARALLQAQLSGGITDQNKAAGLVTAINSVFGFGVNPTMSVAAMQAVAPVVGRFNLGDEATVNLLRSLAATSKTPEQLRINLGQQLRAGFAASSADLEGWIRALGINIPVVMGTPGGQQDTTAAAAGLLQMGLSAGLNEDMAKTFAAQMAGSMTRANVVTELQSRFPKQNVGAMPVMQRMLLLSRILQGMNQQEQLTYLEKTLALPTEITRNIPTALNTAGLGSAMQVADAARRTGITEAGQLISPEAGDPMRYTEARMQILSAYMRERSGDKFRLYSSALNVGRENIPLMRSELNVARGMTLSDNELAMVGGYRELAAEAARNGFDDLANRISADADNVLKQGTIAPESFTAALNVDKLAGYAEELTKRRFGDLGYKPLTVDEAKRRAVQFNRRDLAARIAAAQARAATAATAYEKMKATPSLGAYAGSELGAPNVGNDALEAARREDMIAREQLTGALLEADFPEFGSSTAGNFEAQAAAAVAGVGEPGPARTKTTFPVPRNSAEYQNMAADLAIGEAELDTLDPDSPRAKYLKAMNTGRRAALQKAAAQGITGDQKKHQKPRLTPEQREALQMPVQMDVPPSGDAIGPQSSVTGADWGDPMKDYTGRGGTTVVNIGTYRGSMVHSGGRDPEAVWG